MKAKRFRGSSPNEAIKKAQLSYGDDIFIIETKEVQKRTATSGAIYEVVVGINDDDLDSDFSPSVKNNNNNDLDSSFVGGNNFRDNYQGSSYSQSRFDRELQQKSQTQAQQPNRNNRKKVVSRDVIEDIDLRINSGLEDDFDNNIGSNAGNNYGYNKRNIDDDYLDDMELFNGSMMNNNRRTPSQNIQQQKPQQQHLNTNVKRQPQVNSFDEFGSLKRETKKSDEVFIDVSETAKKISMIAEQKQQEQNQRDFMRKKHLEESQREIESAYRKIDNINNRSVDLSNIDLSTKGTKTQNRSFNSNDFEESFTNKNKPPVKKKNNSESTQHAVGSDNNLLFNDIKSEISALNEKIKTIQNMFWEEKAPVEFTIPPEFSEIYKISRQSGMKKEHLDSIMKLSLQHMPMRMRQNTDTVKKYFSTLLRRMIPTRAETPVESPNKKIMMLVGPTGVGKTTTIAKLAARYSLGHSNGSKKYKVGLVILDTYKIGAVEQLMQYARMMKLNVETVVSPQELSEVIDKMDNNDYILIDTMGSSPYDVEKIAHIEEFLKHSQSELNKIDVMLVMPSSLKYEDLKQTYDNFSVLNIDTIMFTKLDETKGFGNIFSLVHDVKKPISYFSIGQEVPEDIVMATTNYLVDTLLHGFKRDRQ